MIPLPFSEDPSDPLFLETASWLKSQGIAFSQEELHTIYHNVYGHVSHTAGIYEGFWKKLTETDEIDISVPAKSFYNVVLSRVRLSLENMSLETAEKAEFLLSAKKSREATVAMNHFFNEMIKELKADPLLALAS